MVTMSQEFTNEQITEGIAKGVKEFLQDLDDFNKFSPILESAIEKAVENSIEYWLLINKDELISTIAEKVAENQD